MLHITNKFCENLTGCGMRLSCFNFYQILTWICLTTGVRQILWDTLYRYNFKKKKCDALHLATIYYLTIEFLLASKDYISPISLLKDICELFILKLLVYGPEINGLFKILEDCHYFELPIILTDDINLDLRSPYGAKFTELCAKNLED